MQTVEGVAEEIKSGDMMVAVPDGMFLLIMPAHPAVARSSRLDRDALAALMKASYSKAVPSLDDWVAFAYQTQCPESGSLSLNYLSLFIPGGASMLGGPRQWETMRFYGHLGADARASLAAGGKIPFRDLPSGASSSLEGIVYGASQGRQYFQGSFTIIRGDVDAVEEPKGGFRGEYTEVAPNGLPPDGYLELTVDNEPIAVPMPDPSSSGATGSGVFGSQEIIQYRASTEINVGQSTKSEFPIRFKRLKTGVRSILSMNVQVTKRDALSESLSDNRVASDAQLITYDMLPEEFRKQIEESLVTIRSSITTGTTVTSSGTIPP